MNIRIFLFSTLLVASCFVSTTAQTKPESGINQNPFKELAPVPPGEKPGYSSKVTTIPSYPGGQKALAQFIHSRISIPSVLQENEIDFKVVLQFTVKANGELSDFRTVQGNPVYSNEVIAVFKTMPNWHPAKKEGVAIDMRYQIPISLKY